MVGENKEGGKEAEGMGVEGKEDKVMGKVGDIEVDMVADKVDRKEEEEDKGVESKVVGNKVRHIERGVAFHKVCGMKEEYTRAICEVANTSLLYTVWKHKEWMHIPLVDMGRGNLVGSRDFPLNTSAAHLRDNNATMAGKGISSCTRTRRLNNKDSSTSSRNIYVWDSDCHPNIHLKNNNLETSNMVSVGTDRMDTLKSTKADCISAPCNMHLPKNIPEMAYIS